MVFSLLRLEEELNEKTHIAHGARALLLNRLNGDTQVELRIKMRKRQQNTENEKKNKSKQITGL